MYNVHALIAFIELVFNTSVRAACDAAVGIPDSSALVSRAPSHLAPVAATSVSIRAHPSRQSPGAGTC